MAYAYDFQCTVRDEDDNELVAQFEIDDRDQADLVSVDGMTRDAAAAKYGWLNILDMEERAMQEWESGGKDGAISYMDEVNRGY